MSLVYSTLLYFIDFAEKVYMAHINYSRTENELRHETSPIYCAPLIYTALHSHKCFLSRVILHAGLGQAIGIAALRGMD